MLYRYRYMLNFKTNLIQQRRTSTVVGWHSPRCKGSGYDRVMIGWTESKADVGPRPLSTRTLAPNSSDYMQSASTQIYWSALCRDAIFAHLAQQNYEQGGLLLGHVWHQEADEKQIVCIDVVSAVAAPVARGTAVSLAMGTELWDSARAHCVNDQHIIGWYHSHPDLGAFFSHTDRRTQAAFFRQVWQLGLVVDPQRNEIAWFMGPDSVEIQSAAVQVIDMAALAAQALD